MTTIPLNVWAIADLHGRLPRVPYYPPDILCIAGDIAPDPPQVFMRPQDERRVWQNHWLATTFAEWVDEWPRSTTFVMIPGNHDWFSTLPVNLVDTGRVHLLFDAPLTVQGLSMYGTPWIPLIAGAWAWESTHVHQLAAFTQIPEALDILISHSPPYGIFDDASSAPKQGSRALRERVHDVRPRVHIFGHIHEGTRGKTRTRSASGTQFYNVAWWGPADSSIFPHAVTQR